MTESIIQPAPQSTSEGFATYRISDITALRDQSAGFKAERDQLAPVVARYREQFKSGGGDLYRFRKGLKIRSFGNSSPEATGIGPAAMKLSTVTYYQVTANPPFSGYDGQMSGDEQAVTIGCGAGVVYVIATAAELEVFDAALTGRSLPKEK